MINLKNTKSKSIASVPRNFSGQERTFADSVVESIESLSGRRGDLIDRAVTFRDLLDANVLSLAAGQSLTTGGITNPVVVNPTDDEGGDSEIPPAPTNVAVIAGFGFARVTWSMARYRGFGKVEIYRHPTDDIAAATAEGPDLLYFAAGNGSIADTIVNSNTTYYYWVRGVNDKGIAGPFNSSAGTPATTPIDYLYISGLIDDILDDDLNALGLNTISKLDADIAAINAINAWDSTTAYLLEEQVTHSGKIWQAVQPSTNQEPSASNLAYWTNVGNYTSLADFVSAQGTYANASITTLDTNQATIAANLLTLGNSFNGLSSDLSLNYYTKTTADTAISTGIASYTTTLPDGSTATLQQTAESTDGNSAKFAVKIDNNNHVAGFGLVSAPNAAGSTTSAFVVAADRFAIAAPTTASATESGNVGETQYPFKVFTTDHNLTDDNGNAVLDEQGNQVVIPKGAYINDAFIHEAQITTATIGVATITEANILDGAITSATIADTIASIDFNPFAPNTHKTGWALYNNGVGGGQGGFLWCDNANITGAITANSLVLSAGAEIQTLQIAGNAVTVPTYISFPNLNYSVTGSYARPRNTSNALTCGHSVRAFGGRLLVTCTFGVRTTAGGSGTTPEPYIYAKLKVGTDWIYHSNATFGSSECYVGVPQQGSTVANIQCTATLSVATNQNVGTAPYTQTAYPYVNDFVAISLEVYGLNAQLKSCDFTVISCKR